MTQWFQLLSSRQRLFDFRMVPPVFHTSECRWLMTTQLLCFFSLATVCIDSLQLYYEHHAFLQLNALADSIRTIPLSWESATLTRCIFNNFISSNWKLFPSDLWSLQYSSNLKYFPVGKNTESQEFLYWNWYVSFGSVATTLLHC